MPDPAHLETLRSGVAAWNIWRRTPDGRSPDLSGADLRGMNLLDVDLSGAKLARADLSEAVLSRADLSGADLSAATLLDARVVEARLSAASLRECLLVRAQLSSSDLTRADLSGADLSYATLVGIDLSGARLRGCTVYGIGAWDVVTDAETDQRELCISPPGEPSVAVDDLEVAQFVRLLMAQARLRQVIQAVTRRGVLLLGRFSDGGLTLLRSLADALRGAGYLPLLFDFERPTARNYVETVQTLAGLSRFVVAELSGPSVPQELHATVPHFKIPFVPLLRHGERPYAMFADLLEYPWVLEPVRYASAEELVGRLAEDVVAPAERRHAERQARLDQLFGS